MAAFVSTFTDIGLINTTTNAGTITLPPTTQIPYRQLIFKDAYGNVPNKFLTLTTQGADVFEDGQTTRVLKDAYGFTTLYGYNGVWYILGGTTQVQTTISSLTVSSINSQSILQPINLVSTVQGLGSAGYISTASLTSTVASLSRLPVPVPFVSAFTVSTGSLAVSSMTAINAVISSTAYISSLIVESLQFGDGTGYVNIGPIETVALSSIQINTNTLYANNSLFGNTSSLTALQFFGLQGNYNNTVLAEVSTGAGTQELLLFKGSSTSDRVRVQTTGSFVVETGVSARLFSNTTTLPSATPAFLITTDSNVGIRTATPGAALDVAGIARAVTFSSQQVFVSSLNGDIPIVRANLVSSITGLGSASYISSPQLLSTSKGLSDQIQAAAASVSVSQLTSTTRGLGTIGYVSSAALSGFVSTPNLLNLVSTANLTNLVSTTFLDTTLQSTTLGLSRSGYISTPNLATLVSTANLLNLVSTANLTNLVSTQNLLNLISSPNLLSTTAGLERYISSFIDPQELASSIMPFISSPNLANLVSTANLTNLVSTANLATLVSTSFLDTTLQSTTLELSRSGYISTPNLLNLVSTANLVNLVSTANLTNLVSTANLVNLVSTSFLDTTLQSTTLGLSRSGYISTPNLFNLVSTANLVNLVSTANLTNLVSTANLVNFVSTTFLDTTLQSTTLGLSRSGYISTPNLLNLVSTANLINLVSTANLIIFVSTASLTSTVQNLGQIYLSSVTLPSNINALNISTGTLFASSITYLNVVPSSMNMWLALGGFNVGVIKYSSDGFNWSDATGGFAGTANGAAWNGRQWVAVGQGLGTTSIQYSENGRSFSDVTSGGFGNSGNAIGWNGQLWVALGSDGSDKRVQYSSDGLNWINSSGANFWTEANGVAWNGRMWVGVGSGQDPRSSIIYSYDGKNWSNSVSGGFSGRGRGIAWNGRMWVAVGDDITISKRIQFSYDGFNWLSSFSGQFTNSGYGVAWNGKYWVAVGDGTDKIKYSYDGWNWSNTTGQFSGTGFGVSWNGQFWVAAGSDVTTANKLKYSYDGISWSNSVSGSFTSFTQGKNVAYSQNFIGAYQQSNLSILPTNAPNYIGSTNTILIQNSSIVMNDTLVVDRMWNRVGINTNIPQYSLDVFGTANLSTLFINNSSFTSILVSSTQGLGSAGYLSSFNAFSMSTGRINASTFTFVDINTQAQQVLLVSSGTLTLNGQGIGGGGTSGSGMTISDYVVSGKLSADQSLTADVDNDIQFIDDFDPQNWWNASTYFFTPTIAGYYLVTFQVWFNAGAVSNNQWNAQIQKNSSDSYTLSQTVQNTTTGATLTATKIIFMNGSTDNLRFRAYVGNTSNTTSKALQGTPQGAGTYFTAALLTNGSGGQNLISTVAGLGSIGYASTTFVTSAISSFSTAFGPGGTNMATLASTVAGLGTAGYVSSAALRGLVSTPNLLNLVSTANLANLVSTSFLDTTLQSTTLGISRSGYISTPNLLNLVSTANLVNLVSTTFLDTTLQSTTLGLSRSGYISTANLLNLVSTQNLLNLVSTANLVNLVSTQNLLNLISSPNLISTTAGLERYISSFIDPQELASSIMPFISTPNLLNLVSTANLVNLVSTANLANLVSTANLASLVSTSFLDTTLQSTIIGLGTIGYISTATMMSSINGSLSSFSTAIGRVGTPFVLPSTLSTFGILTSSLFASTITASSIFTSSITGSLSQFVALSSLALYVSSFYTATRQATPMFITF